MSPYLVIIPILEFILARLAMQPYGFDTKVTTYYPTCYQAICILIFYQL